MQQSQQPKFGKFRNFFWPIYHYELKKLVPMFVLFFLITFVYNLLRAIKTALVVTAQGSGAEVLTFLKMGGVLPGALLLTYIFTKLINKFTREQVFYTMLSGFLVYFAIFLVFLYPNREYLRLDFLADYLQANVLINPGFKGFIAAIRHFNFSVFYVLSEMWSAVVLSTLFWGFANEVTKIDEAKRFYAIFALGANSSGIFSGFFAGIIRKFAYNPLLPFDPANQWVFYQVSFVLILGLLIMALFYWLNRSVFNMEHVQSMQIPKKTHNISLMECFRYLRSSKYLTYIVIIVISYNIVYNLADTMWAHRVREVYQNSKDFNTYMNQITSMTGIIAVVFAFILSGNVIRYYGWTITALITPIIWLVTSVGSFSGLIFSSDVIIDVLGTFISNPANLFLFLGSAQICFGRACKYTLFDETKEIAFIPLSQENQRKAKAVVDGLASRVGKSGGSLIYIVLLMQVDNFASTMPYVATIILAGIVLWIYAVISLGKIINNTIKDSDPSSKTDVDEQVIGQQPKNINLSMSYN